MIRLFGISDGLFPLIEDIVNDLKNPIITQLTATKKSTSQSTYSISLHVKNNSIIINQDKP